MRCPVCQTVELAIADRQGIEVDYCPSCRGVWLDRGELDKLVERLAPASPPARPADTWEDDRRERRDDGEYESRGRRRRGSLLGELFDFD